MQTATLTPQPAADFEADGLFTALDQRVIGHGDDCWTAFIVGIYNDGRDRWVQVTSGPGRATATILRMSRRATAAHAAAALERLQAATECEPPVIDVMRVC